MGGHVAKNIRGLLGRMKSSFLPIAEDAQWQNHEASARAIADGRALGDTTTLADPAVVAKLKEQYEE
jgi:hypothetical protein